MNKVISSENTYDMIVVGSGNGACGFLSKYLEHCGSTAKILVLEAGKHFFDTSDITHQNNWTKSYAEGKIFQLHNAQTPDNIPIISGWACTMGGGGSINYAMIHESSSWLSNHLGKNADYWDNLKDELNGRLNCLNPWERQTQLTEYILQKAQEEGFAPPKPLDSKSRNIPSHLDLPDGEFKQLYLFSTQFNYFGQRTHSGVSLIDWFDNRIELKTQSQVTELELEATKTEEYRCKAVHVKYLDTGETDSFFLKEGGKVILCAGAATPRLLMPHREKLNNPEIGKHVNDHVTIPLGIYLLNKNLKVTPKDNYTPIFATTVWQPEAGEPGEDTVCTSEFFAGNFERLWFFISHIYLAFLLPNSIKKIMIQTPLLFNAYKMIRLTIEKLNSWLNLWEEIELITVIIKFNSVTEGEYLSENNRINLGFFEANQDHKVAEAMITQVLNLMDKLGDKPHWLVQLIFWFVGIPFNKNQVNKYIERYSKKYLLSQQHLAGGCLLGKAIDKGMDNPEHTGKVYGLTNVHVADLSASPLPRVSSQMTAYLLGFHVATQLCFTKIQKTEQHIA